LPWQVFDVSSCSGLRFESPVSSSLTLAYSSAARAGRGLPDIHRELQAAMYD
jgi:hypothetical protein